jgi:hypothetical protein
MVGRRALVAPPSGRIRSVEKMVYSITAHVEVTVHGYHDMGKPYLWWKTERLSQLGPRLLRAARQSVGDAGL